MEKCLSDEMSMLLNRSRKKQAHSAKVLLRVFQRFPRKVSRRFEFKVNQLVKLRVLKGVLISIENFRENPVVLNSHPNSKTQRNYTC
jgi:hypothetical protein